jgi:hypothetical protein
MSEQRPESDDFDVESSGAPAGGFSSNGTYGDVAVAIAEEDVAAVATEEPAEEPTAAEMPVVAEEPAAEPAPTTAEPAPDDGTAFLAELARAMQATAGLERTRIEEDADRRREAHLAAIQERRESQATTIRELAAEDLKGIDAWAESERERIAAERERRAAALQADLETSLTEHGAKVDREVEGVETAIATYRTEVAGFFATLGQESDPVEIARHASRRPTFPDLDAIEAADATDAPAVAVMDPETTDPDPAVAWSRWNEVPATEAPTDAAEAPTEPAAPAEPEPVAASGTVLQSVPVHRPFSFLRSDRQDDR